MKYLSEQSTTFIINDTEYKLQKWSNLGTILTGKKLLFAVLPAIGMIQDLKSRKESMLDDPFVDGDASELVCTGALAAVCENISDEMFIQLYEDLLSGLSYRKRGEDGELAPGFEPIPDPDKHFSDEDFAEDFDDIIQRSFKENLHDFFMKRRMYRTALETIMEMSKPILTKLGSSMSDGSN